MEILIGVLLVFGIAVIGVAVKSYEAKRLRYWNQATADLEVSFEKDYAECVTSSEILRLRDRVFREMHVHMMHIHLNEIFPGVAKTAKRQAKEKRDRYLRLLVTRAAAREKNQDT